jgi:HAD superfamily hydrolase (TIGR01509 family)
MLSESQPIEAVALDAMGVIYRVADDLRDLLIPFLRGKGCTVPDDDIIAAYRACYRDGAPARTIWERAGVAPALEDEYLAGYELNPGVIDFLDSIRRASIPVYGLSNDLGEWAVRRRQLLGVEDYFAGWVISSEVRAVKPQQAIYQHLVDLLPCVPDRCVFVDDRQANLDGAKVVGLQGVLFSSEPSDGVSSVPDFESLGALVEAHR